MEEPASRYRTRHLNEHKSCASRACELLSGMEITADPRVSRLISLRPWFGKLEVLARPGGPNLGRFWKNAVWGLRPTVFLGPDAIRNIQHISYTVNFSWTASVPMKIHSFSSPSTLGAIQASLSIHGKVHRKRRRERFNCKASHSFKTVERHHLTFRCYKSQDWWGEWLEPNAEGWIYCPYTLASGIPSLALQTPVIWWLNGAEEHFLLWAKELWWGKTTAYSDKMLCQGLLWIPLDLLLDLYVCVPETKSLIIHFLKVTSQLDQIESSKVSFVFFNKLF